jgi:hypothetical protein
MNCKEPISFDFIVANTTKTFLNKKWREKRKEVLIDIEISKLPATQQTASAYKELQNTIKHMEERIIEMRKKVSETLNLEEDQVVEEKLKSIKLLLTKYKENKNDKTFSPEDRAKYKKKYTELIKETMAVIKMYNRELIEHKYTLRNLEHQMTNTDNDENIIEVDRETASFIMPCPLGDCKGFMSKQYKCGMCNGKICSKCHVKLDDKNEEHECNKDMVESVKLINAETKPCPKCGARIHKINGCDQMWCISCKTAFSWNTGKIVVGERIHNPEYYRWMRDNNIQLPREEDHYNCERLPSTYTLNDLFTRRKITANQVDFLFHILQKVVHFEAEIRNNTTNVNRDLRVKFLCNEITKEKMTQTLIKRERINMKKNFLNGLYRLIIDVNSDILRRTVNNSSLINENIKESLGLCKYINEQTKNFTKIHGLTTPQFDESIANLYNLRRISLKNSKDEVDE